MWHFRTIYTLSLLFFLPLSGFAIAAPLSAEGSRMAFIGAVTAASLAFALIVAVRQIFRLYERWIETSERVIGVVTINDDTLKLTAELLKDHKLLRTEFLNVRDQLSHTLQKQKELREEIKSLRDALTTVQRLSR